jgi:hypothetical protein
MNNFQVTFERVYTTTINVSAASEAEAIIAAQEGLAEHELEQMNVDITDIQVKRLDVINKAQLLDKVWQVLYAHDELISDAERTFIVNTLDDACNEPSSADDVERNEYGDEFVVGCIKCGNDVHETNDSGHCKKCAR